MGREGRLVGGQKHLKNDRYRVGIYNIISRYNQSNKNSDNWMHTFSCSQKYVMNRMLIFYTFRFLQPVILYLAFQLRCLTAWTTALQNGNWNLCYFHCKQFQKDLDVYYTFKKKDKVMINFYNQWSLHLKYLSQITLYIFKPIILNMTNYIEGPRMQRNWDGWGHFSVFQFHCLLAGSEMPYQQPWLNNLNQETYFEK